MCLSSSKPLIINLTRLQIPACPSSSPQPPLEHRAFGTESNRFLTVCQERRISNLRPVKAEEPSSPAQTFSLCECFISDGRPGRKSILSRWLPAKPHVSRKKLWSESREVSRSTAWSQDKIRQSFNYPTAGNFAGLQQQRWSRNSKIKPPVKKAKYIDK